MNQSLSFTAPNFQDFLKSRGIEGEVVELPDSTRVAAEAASAIGYEVAEIAKSVIFLCKGYDSAITCGCKWDQPRG